MTLPPSPLEIILSARAARHLRVKPARAMSAAPPHCVTQWRVDTVDDAEGDRWFLLTNVATFYTFLLPRKPSSRFASMVADFQVRLGFALLEPTPPLEWRPSEIILVRGNPRAVIRAMKDMYLSLTWHRMPAYKHYYPDLESSIHDTAYLGIGETEWFEFPKVVWLKSLNELANPVRPDS